MYRSIYGKDAVATTNYKYAPILRFYYFDMNAYLDSNADRYDAVISFSKDRMIKKNFDCDVKLDLSTCKLECKNEMNPVNILFGSFEGTK